MAWHGVVGDMKHKALKALRIKKRQAWSSSNDVHDIKKRRSYIY
jgi:hypothetical protein